MRLSSFLPDVDPVADPDVDADVDSDADPVADPVADHDNHKTKNGSVLYVLDIVVQVPTSQSLKLARALFSVSFFS